MFDMHVTRVLKELWEASYSQDLALFNTLFPELAAADPSATEGWFNNLSTQEYVDFRTAWNVSRREWPQVIINLEEEPLDTQPLGFDCEESVDVNGDVLNTFSLLVQQTAAVRVMAASQEHVRVLHEFVRAAMMQSVGFFAKLGFQGLTYQGGQDLEPDPEAMPELMGIFMRSQRWTTIYEPSATVISPLVRRPPFVHADDVTVNGNTGGVSPDVS